MLLILWVPGVCLQGLGLAKLMITTTIAVDLAVGSILLVPGTILAMYAIEASAHVKGRHPAWALAAFAGPLGLVAVWRLAERQPKKQNVLGAMPGHRSPQERVISASLILIITLGFVWAAWQWLDRDRDSASHARSNIPTNERAAWENLQKIVRAQEAFKRVDWDEDGENSYARFLVHLWQTVDHKVQPIRVGLIPRRLAFAMEQELSLNGYFYRSLYERELPNGIKSNCTPKHRGDDALCGTTFDPMSEWAMAAIPALYGETGIQTFIVERSGNILSRDLKGRLITRYPHDPLRTGWKEAHNE
jgi:hypothetical protein